MVRPVRVPQVRELSRVSPARHVPGGPATCIACRHLSSVAGQPDATKVASALAGPRASTRAGSDASPSSRQSPRLSGACPPAGLRQVTVSPPVGGIQLGVGVGECQGACHAVDQGGHGRFSLARTAKGRH